jgi:hypothetical protein
MRCAALILTVAVVAAIGSGTAQAAAPRAIAMSGGPLGHSVVLKHWPQIFALVESVNSHGKPLAARVLTGRPRIRMAMHWLSADDPPQIGFFYPAWKGRVAAMNLPWAGKWPKSVPPRALAILTRHGIPVG